MNISRLLFGILLLFGTSANVPFAQTIEDLGYTLDDAPKKAQKLYSKLVKKNYKIDQKKRLELLNRIVTEFPNFVDAHTEKAFVLYNFGEINQARSALEISIDLKPEYQVKRHIILANYCRELQDFDCEHLSLKKFLELKPNSKLADKIRIRIQQDETRNILTDSYNDLEIELLSEKINSNQYAEYKPVLSLDESEITFTRRISGQEDFYHSTKDSLGNWLEAEPLEELNTPGNEGAHSISPDGKYLIYTRCDVPKRYRSCDLYISIRRNNKWSKGRYMSNINTEAWESQASFSPDGNTIYFSSARNGNKDLYSISRVDGVWQTAVSLGNTINTTGNEESPFIHPDGRTLYFMSNGHPGLGGMDLLFSKRQLDDSWSAPINMGGAINSSADEGGLYVDIKGEYAYYSKTIKSATGLDSDIYRFRLPKDFKPEPVTYLKLVVKDGLTKKEISAKLLLRQISKGFEKTHKIEAEGKLLVIEQFSDYSIYVEKTGYTFHSERIAKELRSDISKPVEYTIELFPLKKTITQDTLPPVSLRNIFFESGKAELAESSNEELNKLVSLLGANPTKKIIINGHTDNIGNPEDNVILSRQRANAVKAYLIGSGISGDRISSKAFGERAPISTNSTIEGRAMNRRIEFQLINPS
jgi:outer membrane protein OmpA-like peptidoglycan-associated protein/tetratricopeptide (TPR) repeat protein